MPHFDVKKITCPLCQKPQNINVYSSVNGATEQELRDQILTDKFFYRKCKHCSGVFELKYPLLYNDTENEFMVYYIPNIENSRIIDKELEKEYEDLSFVRKRIVPEYDLLKEKILIFESGLDDMAIEISKLAVADALKNKTDGDIKRVTFSFCHREKNTIGFIFETDNAPYCQSTRLEIYDKARYIANKMSKADKNMTGFLKIDKEWANNMLDRFKLMEKRREKLKNENESKPADTANTDN